MSKSWEHPEIIWKHLKTFKNILEHLENIWECQENIWEHFEKSENVYNSIIHLRATWTNALTRVLTLVLFRTVCGILSLLSMALSSSWSSSWWLCAVLQSTVDPSDKIKVSNWRAAVWKGLLCCKAVKWNGIARELKDFPVHSCKITKSNLSCFIKNLHKVK